jgi:chromosome segregation ATPase
VSEFEALKEYINPTWEREAYEVIDRIEAYCKYADQCGEELGKARAEVERLQGIIDDEGYLRQELKAEVERLRDEVKVLASLYADKEAEVERLRSALERCVEGWRQWRQLDRERS